MRGTGVPTGKRRLRTTPFWSEGFLYKGTEVWAEGRQGVVQVAPGPPRTQRERRGVTPQRASSTGTPGHPLREGAQTCAPPLHTPVFPPGPAEQGARGTRADGCCLVGVLPKRGEGANRRWWETQMSAQGRPCRAARGEHPLSSCYSAPLCRDLAEVHPRTAP